MMAVLRSHFNATELKIDYPERGATLEKRYDAHPPSWLVVSAGQQGDFFADKSLNFGSTCTSSRGCLISIMYHIVYSSHVLACNSTLISHHRLLGGSSPLPSAMVAQSVSAKLGLGQIS